MKSRQTRRPEEEPAGPSSSQEETNLLAGRDGGNHGGNPGGNHGNSSHTGEEEVSDEEDEGSGPADEEDGDSGEGGEGGGGSPEIPTREDMKKGAFPLAT